jgi:hypothetical protein
MLAKSAVTKALVLILIGNPLVDFCNIHELSYSVINPGIHSRVKNTRNRRASMRNLMKVQGAKGVCKDRSK